MPGIGEVCALLAPLTWAVAVILFKQSGDAPAISLNLFKNLVGVALLSLTMAVLGIGLPADRSAGDWVRLAVSGVLGLAVADTLFFEGIRRIGAARVAVCDTVYAPLVVGLSWVFLHESLGSAFLAGAVAVVAGVLVASVDRKRLSDVPPPDLLVGVLCTIGGVAFTAIGVVIAKPALGESNLVEATWLRLVAGIAAQVLWIGLSRRWSEAAVAFRPSPLWRTLLPGAVLGPYVSLLFWLGGFKWADASVAAVLNQMATVYILVLARVVLKERLQVHQVAGGLVACGGALWIVVGR